VNTRRIIVFEVKNALLTSRDEECGFSQENGEQHRKDPFDVVVRIYRRLQRRAAWRETGRPLLHGSETECIQAITLRKFDSEERNIG
jgi:hypothetical protein